MTRLVQAVVWSQAPGRPCAVAGDPGPQAIDIGPLSDYPDFTGPIAVVLGGLNFAWIVGFVVCVVLYWLLERNNSRAHSGTTSH